MGKTMTAIYDGRILLPESPLDLEPDTRCLVTIETFTQPSQATDVWSLLEALQGTLEAPDDWAGEHDHYLYGVPRQQ